MKAILVGTINNEKKLYYVIDSKSKDRDGVISDGENSKIVNFWKTAVRINGLKPIKTSNFHKFFWDNEIDGDEDIDRWKRIFVNKNQKIPEHILSGVTIVSDVLKSKVKHKSVDRRIFEFKTLLNTQNVTIVRNKSAKAYRFIEETDHDDMG